MYRSLLVSFVLALLNLSAFTQATNVSPYSRYGLGDIYDMQMAHQTGMGGVGIAFSDTTLANFLNPASYAFIIRHNPVLDVGARGRMLRLYTSGDSAKNYTVSLSNLVMAIPIKKRAGLAFGLVPMSTTGYDITYTVNENTLGNVRYSYQGNGGINRAFIGFAYRIIKQPKRAFSLGVNGSYLFGELQKVRKVIYLQGGSGTYHTKIINSVFVHDVAADAGLLYQEEIHPRMVFRVGLTYAIPMNISATRTQFAHTFVSTLTENVIDTVSYEDNVKGHFTLPAKWGYGMSLDIKGKSSADPGKLTIAAQYIIQNWSTYEENFGTDVKYDFLRNSTSLNVGLQWVPHTLSPKTIKIRTFKFASYRLGFYQRKSYLNLQENQITDQGLTFGIGIPMFHSFSYSMLNFGFELGKRGTTSNSLIMEKYLGVHVGYSFSPNRSDRWFIKRKFD